MKFLGILLVSALADHPGGNRKREDRIQRRRDEKLKTKLSFEDNDDDFLELNSESLSYEDDPFFGSPPEIQLKGLLDSPYLDPLAGYEYEAKKKVTNPLENPLNLEYNQVIPKKTKQKYVRNAIIMLHNFKTATYKNDEVPRGTEMIFNATLSSLENLMLETNSIPYILQETIKRKKDAAFLGEDCGPSTECGAVFEFSKIWNYGCWCYFGDNAGEGKGMPQNALDKACKNLQLCYRCVKIDSLGDEEMCHPGNTKYKYEIDVDGGIYQNCALSNSEECAVHTCSCEQDFIRKLVGLLWNGYIFDYSFHHSVWAQWNVCNFAGGPHILDCCGEYPKRRPFFSDTNFDCCKNKIVYNFTQEMCCDDGTVRDKCE